MEVQPNSDASPSLRERTVSDLALLFEAKIKDKLASSPYLRHYGNFAARKLEKVNSNAKDPTANGEKLETSGKDSQKLLQSKQESQIRIVHVLPFVESSNEKQDDSGKVKNCPEPQNNSHITGDLTGPQPTSAQDCDKKRTVPPLKMPASFFYEKPPSPRHSVEAVEVNLDPPSPHEIEEKKERQGYIEYIGSPKRSPEVKRTKKGTRKGLSSKHKRTGSLASGLQRLIGLDKRRGSLDEREIARLREAEYKSMQNEPGSRTTDLSFLRRAGNADRGTDSENSTPKLSFEARRNTIAVFKEREMPKHEPRKKRRFKRFFRAMSFTNVRDVKRTQVYMDEEFCCDCQQKRIDSSHHLSSLSFNVIKDERDHMKYERDRAVEEWTEAASKWEFIIDEMDVLLEELTRVKKERDTKENEITEIIDKYENELTVQEQSFVRLAADLSAMEAQLAVAKKERVDALTAYDDLLKRHYDIQQDLDSLEDENIKLRSHVKGCEESITSLQQQVDNLQQERDHALHLWNSSVKERKKLHQEMEALIQSRDASLRKAFQQAEDLNKMREDRDALQRAVNSSHGSMRQGTERSLERPRSIHSRRFDVMNYDGVFNGTDQILDNNSIPEYGHDEFIEFAVSLDRLDSKYGIKVDTAVDEPNIMIVHVGAHVSSRTDIRIYDRILSINGTSVYRSDKKTVEKLLRDCPGRLTMVLRRENSHQLTKERVKDVEITIPKTAGQNSKRLNPSLGIKCKVEIIDVDEFSSVSGAEEIDPGDVILNVNTQDISKVFEALLCKLAKKRNGKIALRLKKTLQSTVPNGQAKQILSPSATIKTQSLSDVSESSNQSLASFTSEETTATTDDGGSLFSGSLAPSTLYTFSEDGNDEDDIMSLPERLRKISSSFPETERTVNDNLVNGHQQDKNRQNGHALTNDNTEYSDRIPTRRSSETRSYRSLKNAYSSRAQKPLRRARSDAVDRKPPEKLPVSPERDKAASNPSVCAKSLQDPSDKSETNSWLMPSPEMPRKSGLNENNAINIFATLPRQKKKSVNEADCNKRTTHRVLRLEKSSHEQMGFDICGGNKVGIFVKEIQEGSMAALGGMKVGDRLLYLNSFDLNGATLDFAMRVVLRSNRLTSFRIEVKFEEKFKEIMKEVPRDSLYVRTLRSSDMNETSELSFGVGEVLHITNTVANLDKNFKTSWMWFGEKVSKKAAGEAGLIPRLESFIEHDEPESAQDHDTDPDKTPTNQKKRRRPSAADVKKWLLRKPSMSRAKKEKERPSGIVIEHEDRDPYYEILVDK